MVKYLCSDKQDNEYKLLNMLEIDPANRAFLIGQNKIMYDIEELVDGGLDKYKPVELTEDERFNSKVANDVYQAIVEGKTKFN